MTNTADFSVAPVNTVMPELAQTIVFWNCIALFVLYLVLGLRVSRRYNTLLPFILIIAGFCTIIMEPIVILLGHCYHPDIGQWTMFKRNPRAIPWHVPLAYAIYYGAAYLAVFGKIVEWRGPYRLCMCCRENRHQPVKQQHETLRRKVQGHINYFGVNGYMDSLERFLLQVRRSWFKWLNRRSQRARLTWERYEDLLGDFPLPKARIVVKIWR